VQKHVLNIDIMLNNPMAIHEHTNFMEAIELELAKIAEYQDKLEALTLVSKNNG
jgi:replication initiation and membrane attachment protein DnaB